MNVLLIGGGGREHALAFAIARSPACDTLFAAPGNPGMEPLARCVVLDVSDHRAVTAFCAVQGVGLVVVGPEAPLVAGLADDLRAAGIAVFGPSAAAARLEGSKAFTKAVCDAAGVPTAGYAAFDDLENARAYVERVGVPIVVKADGLAAGKGVTVAASKVEAVDALSAIFAEPGASVVVEECLVGEEASFFFLCDGTTALPFGTAQDHKRVGEGDTGPNTGGMGAYSPAPVLTPELQDEVAARIVRPTLDHMAAAGMPFAGVLYVGLMLTGDGPKLIEYNVRFGDPECQVLMMRLASDLLPYLEACAHGRLAQMDPPCWREEVALTVVMAADGYPGPPRMGTAISLPADADTPTTHIFHAGTRREGERLVSAGGRVLAVTALGATVRAAADTAYALVDRIVWPEGFCRRDIGWRAMEREDER